MDNDQIGGAVNPLEEMATASEQTEAEKSAQEKAANELKELEFFAKSAGWAKLRQIMRRDLDAITHFSMVDITANDQQIASDFKANAKLADLLSGYIAAVDAWVEQPSEIAALLGGENGE